MRDAAQFKTVATACMTSRSLKERFTPPYPKEDVWRIEGDRLASSYYIGISAVAAIDSRRRWFVSG